MTFSLPGTDEADTVFKIDNGLLISSDEQNTFDPMLHVPQSILVNDAKSFNIARSRATFSEIVSPDSADTPMDRLEKVSAEKTDYKKVHWGNVLSIWLSPTIVEKLQGLLKEKKCMVIEFSRTVHSKYASAVDTMASKYAGKISIEYKMLMHPNVIGLKGRFSVENTELPPLPESGERKRSGTLFYNSF